MQYQPIYSNSAKINRCKNGWTVKSKEYARFFSECFNAIHINTPKIANFNHFCLQEQIIKNCTI